MAGRRFREFGRGIGRQMGSGEGLGDPLDTDAYPP